MIVNRDGSTRNEGQTLGFRFEMALLYAYRLHAQQTRKGGNVPYFGHLLGVASIVIEAGGDEEEAIAALLHDAVEDQGGQETADTIAQLFGGRVAGIVDGCSDEEPGSTVRDARNWPQRKSLYLEHIPEKPADVLLVSLADKIYNARSVLFDLRALGDALWSRFNHGRDRQLWYYRGLAVQFRGAAQQHPSLEPLAAELSRIVGEIFEQCGEELTLEGGVGHCPPETTD